jgi:hypothetical protein
VDAAGVPSVDSLCPAEGYVAYKRVTSPIVVASVVVCAVMVFLYGVRYRLAIAIQT